MIRLFRVSIPATVLLLVVSDTLLIASCYILAALIGLNPFVDPWLYFLYENGWVQLLLAVFVIQIGLYFMDLYDDLRLRSRALLIQQLCLLLGVSFLIQALVGYSESTLLQLPQWTMVYGSFFVLLAVPAWRALFFSVIRRALPNQKVLFLGFSPDSEELMETISTRPDLGYEVVGYLNAEGRGGAYLGTFECLAEVMRNQKPSLVVVDKSATLSIPVPELLAIVTSGARMEDTARLFEMVFGRVPLRGVESSQVLFSDEFRPKRWVLHLQTLYSFFLALIGLILFSPIMVLVFIAVKLTSPGPALYKQKRVGRDRKPFYLYKFRSMYIDAEARSGPVWATKNDPRITPLGRWLRKLRLDELPQFFNVLRGEMSVAGPRPERPEFCEMLAQKIPMYHQRHVVKPGITGWAQVNHKYTETIEDTVTKLEYDLYYVKHLAPALDIYIIFHTAKVMLLFRGAQ